MNTKKKDNDFYQYGHMGQERVPNGTIIRESLKMVGRLANITANNGLTKSIGFNFSPSP